MGNNACRCVNNRSHSKKVKSIDSQIHSQINDYSQQVTPYDNKPDSGFKMADSILLEPSDSASDNVIETPIVARKAEVKECLKNGYPVPPVSFNGNNRTNSLFCTDELLDEEMSTKLVNPEIYDIILRELLMEYYPINEEIIKEMIQRNLLLEEDSQILLSRSTDAEKTLTFLNNFVFSEVNICKLATFLHLLLTSKSQILSLFKESEQHFQSIVDHIYYVVNVLSLLADCFKDQGRLTARMYLSSMVTMVCLNNARSFAGVFLNRFYAKVSISNFVIPEPFCRNFACINEHFRCCGELTLSSCDLCSEDVRYIGQGFRGSKILKELDISFNPITDEGLSYLKDLFLETSCLASVNISCCSLTNSGVEQFLDLISANLQKCALRHLNISHNKLRPMSQRHVMLLTKLPLATLEMRSVDLQHQSCLFESLKLNYSLREIDFSGNRLLPNDLAYLAAGLAYNTSLLRISLANIGVLKSDCATINNALLMNKSIVAIDLSDNLIGDEGADVLKDVLTMKPTLRELCLKRCGISLYGTLTLVRRASEPECNLRLLDLCHNHSPRMSVVVDVRDHVRKIQDLMHHLSLVKEMRVLLWGTLDDPLPSHGDSSQI